MMAAGSSAQLHQWINLRRSLRRFLWPIKTAANSLVNADNVASDSQAIIIESIVYVVLVNDYKRWGRLTIFLANTIFNN